MSNVFAMSWRPTCWWASCTIAPQANLATTICNVSLPVSSIHFQQRTSFSTTKDSKTLYNAFNILLVSFGFTYVLEPFNIHLFTTEISSSRFWASSNSVQDNVKIRILFTGAREIASACCITLPGLCSIVYSYSSKSTTPIYRWDVSHSSTTLELCDLCRWLFYSRTLKDGSIGVSNQ